jgi:hypothetical protein
MSLLEYKLWDVLPESWAVVNECRADGYHSIIYFHDEAAARTFAEMGKSGASDKQLREYADKFYRKQHPDVTSEELKNLECWPWSDGS